MQQPDIRLLPSALGVVCQRIAAHGGRAWLVGGSVRDMMLGLAPKDFDIEVYGLDSAALVTAIQTLGRTETVGRQFGVLKLWSEGLEMDLALPRSERKQGAGHKAFEVQTDPGLDAQTASSRRDFTINAMMLDPLTGELLDLHGGQNDLQNRILRHVSTAFAEDPLRPLRGMQFAARFRLTLDSGTAALCRSLLAEAATLPAARIWEEWRKWAHADAPSFGLQVLRASGWLALYPQLEALIGCEQEEDWHPEGDVWTHTALVLDQSSAIALRYNWNDKQREQLVFASLCHDLGKPSTTFRHENGRIRATGHAEAGIEPSKAFLESIAAPQSLTAHVLSLVAEHLVHLHGNPSPRAVRRLAHRLQPSNIHMWEALVEADASGRPPLPADRPALSWLEEAVKLAVEKTAPEALANGEMLIELGIQPGPAMGEILTTAYQAQLDGEFTDSVGARLWLSQRLGKH
ncbi:MAG: tRNA nucleotidyltransferase [Zetaproteobacteria bacterium CG06_land_8_20_14_3_00_59_53]|nr:MAG: tRNA nucleotidyltransferase [Zetaproteobacteria bacterium CG2_30_59_37]PIO90684.1 MAG: tRNA nucleotidyltransferase [Zetaproteobacteria bacterium CG23_combo_of_CG06-09_8_20_14_all_59_86]PIQ66053.1 MAG: tRNA nucleotidyltransferase [Zetaproteobacteria bacterium CG11_big_fil_rev_8_21_14_0_20_59_439]PIU69993.1 MAG: tRNA nucleotidyltransferase [Zetaproteobacteria bacterium CG06_land_8_20_14_3_00_59_53]PIU97891.1 MAG: tRNA nucleotidyltransferase [Zetaproteobacteria bacterium CG03_land_8_20_14_